MKGMCPFSGAYGASLGVTEDLPEIPTSREPKAPDELAGELL